MEIRQEYGKIVRWVMGILPLSLLLACSNIDESERFIYVPPTDVQRAVLIEDFTGQACVNCPAASDVILDLQNTLGENNIIPVAIHSGPFAHKRSNMSAAFLSDLGTETGDKYFNHWGIEAQPGVKINRGEPIYDTKQYAAAVQAEMQKPSPVFLEDFQATCADGKTINIVIHPSVPTADVDARLQVWIVEDGINAEGGNSKYVQLMGDGSANENYVHHHVFRASLTNDLFGDPYRQGAGEKILVEFNYSKAVESHWKVENLSVVAFLWNEKDGVLCVSREKLKVKN